MRELNDATGGFELANEDTILVAGEELRRAMLWLGDKGKYVYAKTEAWDSSVEEAKRALLKEKEAHRGKTYGEHY